MKKFLSYIFLFSSSALVAQEPAFTFKNDFDDPLLNTQEINTNYSKMYYENGEQVFELLEETQAYFNTEYAVIDEKNEFIIETQISADFSKFKSGKIGIVWGYHNNKNNNVFLINESNQYRVYYNDNGQHPVQAFNATGLTLPELNSKINIRIHQKNGLLHFFLNNKEIFSCAALKLYGHRIGYLIGTDVRTSYLYVKQNRGPLLVSTTALKDFVKKEQCSGGLDNKYNEIKPIVSYDANEIFFVGEERRGLMRTEKEGTQLYSASLNSDPVLHQKKLLGELLPGVTDVHLLKKTANNDVFLFSAVNKIDSFSRDFYSVKWDGNSFSSAKKLFKIKSDQLLFGEGCFSSDESVFVFSGRMINDIPAQSDLYMCRRINDTTWSAPLQLTSISSVGDDITPFLFYDDHTLYFSSDGRAGFGKTDVFVTKRLDDSWRNWSVPENVGPVVNGKAWDGYFYIPENGDYAWMSSTAGFYNCLDLHRVKMNLKKEWLLHGTVLNTVTDQVLPGARVRLTNSITKKLIDSLTVGKSGEYRFSKIKPGEYILEAESGIMHNSIVISVLENRNDYNYNVVLTPPSSGSTLVLKNISFEPNKFEILSSSFPELEKLAKYLNENKELRIEVHGHTSMNSEGEKFNIDLSTNRAAAIKNYLISHGIKSERIAFKGYGFNEPIYKGEDPDLQSVNRRVEIIFLK